MRLSRNTRLGCLVVDQKKNERIGMRKQERVGEMDENHGNDFNFISG